jgi:hypothetical protein
MRCFLSYNAADKDITRSVGAHLALSGLEVWFDEWEITAGDSVPGKLDKALVAFDAFVLIWSAAASRSPWVRQELYSAIVRALETGSAKIIACRRDETPLPALISDRRWIDMRDPQKGVEDLLGDLLGVRTRRLRLLAIQGALDDMDVEWFTSPAAPPLLCCPSCGETDYLESWEATDTRGDRYAGVRCSRCSWSNGGEV